jgi:hypothetical protein
MPGQLVFVRDMILNEKHEANWEYIMAQKQNIILKIIRQKMPREYLIHIMGVIKS